MHLQNESFFIKEFLDYYTHKSPDTAFHDFIELDFGKKPALERECIVEMENKNGSKMKVCIKGKGIDLLELARTFLTVGGA